MVDLTLAGTKVTIKGERGLYTITARETNTRINKSWFCLIGGPTGTKQWRFKYPCDVKLAKGQKRVDIYDAEPEAQAFDAWDEVFAMWTDDPDEHADLGGD